MAKTAFITGITGQDGAYLAKLLLDKGYDVHGGVRRTSDLRKTRLEILKIAGDVQLHDFELGELNNTHRILKKVRIDEFYNLAAQSFVGTSWDLPIYAGDINGLGVARILDSLRTLSPDTRFYQASSSEMFGRAEETPQVETTRFHPRSPYGVAKVYGHHITVNHRESFGMHASCGILFNHESPLRGKEFVTGKITLALARIAHGASAPCVLGNLDARRDWGFAGDYVDGIWRMLQQESADDYILATGVTSSVRDFVFYAGEALGMNIEWTGEGLAEQGIDRKTGKVVVAVSEEFFRPAEVERLLGDASKARRILGWTPTMQVRQIAAMMARHDYDDIAARK